MFSAQKVSKAVLRGTRGYKQLAFGNDGRKRMLVGVETLARAVSSVYFLDLPMRPVLCRIIINIHAMMPLDQHWDRVVALRSLNQLSDHLESVIIPPIALRVFILTILYA